MASLAPPTSPKQSDKLTCFMRPQFEAGGSTCPMKNLSKARITNTSDPADHIWKNTSQNNTAIKVVERPVLRPTSNTMNSTIPSIYPTYGAPAYELCKGEHTECTSVTYREEDETKGSGSRLACARHRENLAENLTAYFCEKPDKPCMPYTVFGRKGYSENFERHVMCVKLTIAVLIPFLCVQTLLPHGLR
ncbi:hypothetical protein SprV_0602221800 [Sparganum proliferum]